MANLYRRIASLFRRKGRLSAERWARQVPIDPAEHAADFASRYAEPLDYLVAHRMQNLGIPEHQIGFPDLDHGAVWRAFFPDERKGGSVIGVRIGVDSGILNPELLTPKYGPQLGAVWAKMRLRDRLDAVIAHEHVESAGISHEAAVHWAAETRLPIRESARRTLRAIAEAEKRLR